MNPISKPMPLCCADPMVEQAAERGFAAVASRWLHESHGVNDAPHRLALRKSCLDTITGLGFCDALPDLNDRSAWPDAAAILRAQAASAVPLDMAQILVCADHEAAIAVDPAEYPSSTTTLAPKDRAGQSALAMARCLQICASLAAALDLSARYVQDRQQFGRPLAKFQAVQHALAIAAEECAAATAATDLALAALCEDGPDSDRLAALLDAAAIVVEHAVDVVFNTSHQVHGAIGFTQEYELHRHSLNMLRWRDALMLLRGGSTAAAERLGAAVVAQGALWPTVITLMSLKP